MGSDLFGARERLFGSATPPAKRSAFSRVLGHGASASAGRPTVLRSQPWWQRVTRLRGTGPSASAVSVAADAIQWRVKARCGSGHLTVRTPGGATPLVDTPCPAAKTAYGSGTGERRLQIDADGPWRVDVEQQVDVPLDEPPLPAMRARGSSVVGTGRLYRIDQYATGTATLYRLPSGRSALRLRDFYVTPNVDLELRLSRLAAPRSTAEFRRAASSFMSRLDVTAGSLNFVLPKGLDPTGYRSVVVWCPPVLSAYGAATLEP